MQGLGCRVPGARAEPPALATMRVGEEAADARRGGGVAVCWLAVRAAEALSPRGVARALPPPVGPSAVPRPSREAPREAREAACDECVVRDAFVRRWSEASSSTFETRAPSPV